MSKHRKKKRIQDRNPFKPRRYTRETVMRDREYGMFWYAWLWQILRPVVIFMCALLIVVGLISTAWDKIYNGYISAPDENDYLTPGFTISSGESISAIGKNLEAQGYIKSPSVFKYYIQFYGLTNKIQSGMYYLSRDMNLFEVVDAISSGNATNERTIRIIPGWTVEDISKYLKDIGAIANESDFLSACKQYEPFLGYSLALINAESNENLMRRAYPLEGYLAPDTYRVYLSADAQSIIRTLLRQTDVVYASLFTNEAVYDENGNLVKEADPYGTKQVPLTESQIITLASVIEKEATTIEDMKKVSAVFYNRLAAGMRLESDPTATYLTGTTRLALTTEDISANTQYNTYRVAGLPVGPICNPSKNALVAAMNPDETFINENYLFFCAAEPASGKLVFAKTNEEHEANVNKYRPLWQAYDLEHNAQ
ncbi:MAG: endolytic transglycosylase MltG [Clostridia bacterium]|nr:endolytic transglycosylase MltG [Clostridia bacterium]